MRSVSVVDILCKHLALVIPVSTKLQSLPGYLHFEINGEPMTLCVHQVRALAQRRLFGRKSKLCAGRLQQVKEEFERFWR